MRHNPKYRWYASAKTPKGKPAQLNAVHCDECPVSYITPESRTLVQVELESRATKEAGGVFLGADSALWPAWWHDVVVILENERRRALAVKDND